MTTVLFLSGGLDSTTALIKLLLNTNMPLHVHYIEYRNKENRWQAEKEIIPKIIKICNQHFRQFNFSESIQDFTNICIPIDMYVTRFVGALFARFSPYHPNQLATGRCKDDESPDYLKRLQTATQIYEATLGNCKRKCEWIYPVANMTKIQEVKYLQDHAPDLIPLLHYCRKPVEIEKQWLNCGKCKTCKQMKIAAPQVYELKQLANLL